MRPHGPPTQSEHHREHTKPGLIFISQCRHAKRFVIYAANDKAISFAWKHSAECVCVCIDNLKVYVMLSNFSELASWCINAQMPYMYMRLPPDG